MEGGGVKKITVTGLAPGVTEKDIKCYLTAGVDEDLDVISISELKDGKAYVEVKGLEDVNAFCARQHKIKKKPIQITHCPPVKTGEHQFDDKSVLEVTCPDELDKEVLEYYFQGSKSGGGGDKTVEWIKTVGKGVFHVKFESEEDAAAVVSQGSHAIMRKKLSVCYCPPTPPKSEYELDKLMIRDIPEGVDEEFLITYLEARLQLDIKTDFTVEIRHSCALITFVKQLSEEEVKSMSQRIMKKKIRDQTLSVDCCPLNRSIIINHIGKDSCKSKDFLEVYFENSKNGGGDDMVDSVVMLGAERAKVTFRDSHVVARVLAKKHPKLGPNVSLISCTPLDEVCADNASENTSDPPSTHKVDDSEKNEGTAKLNESTSLPPVQRKPIIVPLDPLIAKYLHHKPEVLKGLTKEVKMSADIDTDCGTMKLLANESSSLESSEANVEHFQYLLSELVCKIDVEIPSEAAKGVYPLVMQCCSQDSLQFTFAQGKLSIAGETKAVTDLQTKVQELCKRMIQTTDVFTLSPEDYTFFVKFHFKHLKQRHPHIKLELVEADATISASGSIHDVAQFKDNLANYLAHGKVTVNLAPLAVEFLQKGRGLGILETLVRDAEVIPYFLPCSQQDQSYTLLLLCAHDNANKAESLAADISSKITMKKFKFPPYFYQTVAETQKFSDFKEAASKKYAYLCAVDDSSFSLACREDILPSLSKMFEKFVAEECSTTETITMKRGTWRFLHSSVMSDKWSKLVEDMEKKKVSVVSSSKLSAFKPFMKIKGERDLVNEMKHTILELQSSVKEEHITLARPGIVQYFAKEADGQTVLNGVESQAQVCIELEVKESDADVGDSEGSTPNFKKVCFANTKNGQTLSVFVGDITMFNRAEVIVNAANEDLEHGGGVALAIADCGGPIISKDSREYVRSRGKVHTGSAVIFHRVGNLPQPYKAIVHAVGPIWNSSDKERKKALLRKTVKNSLKVSCDYTSIAFPAISSGVYDFPLDVCAESLIQAAVEFLENNPESKLSDINFVVFKANADVFVNAMKQKFEDVRIFDNTRTKTPLNATSDSTQETHRSRRRTSTKPTSVLSTVDDSPPKGKVVDTASLFQYIKITKGDILKHQGEILVNTTDQQLGFGGLVGGLLLKAAGPGLNTECQAVPKPVSIGDVVTTGAHNLDCKHIVHVVLPGYDGTQSEMTLKTVVKKCLQECSRLKAKSVSIPSIGAGNLKYPGNVVARCLLEESVDYMSNNKGKTTLQLINFVIFDGNVHQAFQTHYKQMSSTTSSSGKAETPVESQPARGTSKHREESRPNVMSSSEIPDSDHSCSFFLPNGLKLQVLQGDITDEPADVIVNTTNPELKLVGGGVAGALLKKAGPGLQSACDTLIAQGFKGIEGKVVETMCEGMGQLRCKSIFHIVFEGKDQRKLVKTVLACLDRAEKMRYTSIAFPAIGTGNMSYPPALSAEAIVKALKQFTQRKPNHVKIIRMVIFIPKIYQQFTVEFKKIGENQDGILKYIYDKGANFFQTVGSFFNPSDGNHPYDELNSHHSEDLDATTYKGEKDEEDDFEDLGVSPLNTATDDSAVILCIYGETDSSVKRAEKRLLAIIDTCFVTEEIDDDSVTELRKSAILELEKFAKSHHVDIDIDTDTDIHTIKLHGCQRDVFKVKDKVRDVFAEIRKLKTKEELADVVHKNVRWVRQLSNDQEDYDQVISYDIEQAFKQQKNVFMHKSEAENFKVDFKKMEETDLDSGEVIQVLRIDMSEVEKPPDWDTMPSDSSGKEVPVHLVDQKPGSNEYNDVLSKFDLTMKGRYTNIVSIQRMQNPIQYGQYVARKREMEKRNPTGCKNELMLFHGTKPNVVESINTQGFNRSFKNVCAFGQGVYFARDASYSHGYTAPNASGHRQMYLTRVLTGEYTLGNSSMLVPPPKPNSLNRQVLFDSTVNNEASPTIFVVYTDSQAYAAYLITYQ